MISTKGRYAIRLMIDLAEQGNNTPVALDAIATRQNISKKYLESIAKTLVAGKLLKSSSGKGGGYTLLRKPEEYSVFEILNLTEGSLATVACLESGAEKCPQEGSCRTISMWRGYEQLTQDYFSKISIADLCRTKSE